MSEDKRNDVTDFEPERIVNIKNINRDGLFVEFETNEPLLYDDKITLSFVDDFDSYWTGLTKYTMVLNCHIVRSVISHNKLQLGLSVNNELFKHYYDDMDSTFYIRHNLYRS